MSQPGDILAVNDPRLDEKARRFEILIGIFFPLSTIALLLRLYIRFKRTHIPTIDDNLAILAYAIWVVWVGLGLWGKFPMVPYPSFLLRNW